MEKFLLGIDNVGTVTNAALYTVKGKEVATSTKKTKMFIPKPFNAERDIDELWGANVYVIKDVLHQSKIDAQQISGISITGHGNGEYLMNKEGEATYKGRISTDTRGTGVVAPWYNDPRIDTGEP